MADVDSDPGLGSAVLRALIGAILIVAIPSLVFWTIGSFGNDDATMIADSPADDQESAADDDVSTDGDSDVDAGTDGGTDPGTDGGTDPDTDGGTDPGTDGDTDPDTDGDTDGDGGEGVDVDPEPEPDPDPDPVEPQFPPGEVTVQVLNGNRASDGSAARNVAEQLRDAGYRVIAENPAIAYEVTTVLWTAGFEAQGRQVAAELGAPESREQPGNLSTQVMVHVVVGADRG